MSGSQQEVDTMYMNFNYDRNSIYSCSCNKIKKKYPTVRKIPKSNRKIEETGKIRMAHVLYEGCP